MKKKLLSMSLLFLFAFVSASLSAQQTAETTSKENTLHEQFSTQESELRNLRKELYKEYSRWTIGVDAGMPFLFGDVYSLSKDKNYPGGQFGLNVGYQLLPAIGFKLSAHYGFSKLASPHYAKDYILGQDGMTYYKPNIVENGVSYADIYSKVRYFGAGFHVSLNMNNLLFENRGERLLTVLLEPAVYLQKFNPKVYDKNGNRVAKGALDNRLGFGAGGDLAFRFRTGKLVDLQLSTGIVWLNNNNFDGIRTEALGRDSYIWNSSVSVIFKINGKKKVDNLMYAPSIHYLCCNKDNRNPEYENRIAQLSARLDSLKNAPKEITVIEKEPEKNNIEIGDTLLLPSIYFRFDLSIVDSGVYEKELQQIITLLRNNPDAQVIVEGYTDHHGSDAYNQKLSEKRAEATVKYLVSQGFSAERFTPVGKGKDTKTSGKDQWTILARRADLIMHKNK